MPKWIFFILALFAVNLASGCSKDPKKPEVKVEGQGGDSFDVSRADEPTPEVGPAEPSEFPGGSIAETTITTGNIIIGLVDVREPVCGKLLGTEKLGPKKVKVKLQLGKPDNTDADNCTVIIHPEKGKRPGFAYLRVNDTPENIARRQQERQEQGEREAAEAMQKYSDMKTTVKETAGKAWDIKYSNGATDRWTLKQVEAVALFKNQANEDVMLMFNPDEKKWMATAGACTYEVTIDGTTAKGKAAFCQQASKALFTGTISK
jgi:hypothetical protein